MDTERAVASHYTQGNLEQSLLRTLAASGRDPDRLAPDDLAPLEEFHIGGRQATADLAPQMGLRPGMHLLDVGSGIGGPARYFARVHGCQVTGIDLTDEFVEVARSLSARVGLADRVAFQQGSALDLPFADASFDGAYILHVGMNIADKRRLFASVRRVLKPGALFTLYDVMRLGPDALDFPLPWSSVPETSFVATPDEYREGLIAAGFTVAAERERRQFAIDFFRAMQARAAQPDAPPGIGNAMGKDAGLKSGNLLRVLTRGTLAPVEMIARAI